MDKLAAALELDPIELRLLQCARARRHAADRPADRLLAADRRGDPRRRRARAAAAPRSCRATRSGCPGGAGNTTRGEGVRRGTGFAVGFKNIAFSEGFDDYCAARVRLLADGSAEVHCAAAEAGQGVTNVILQVARTELGIDDVRLAPPSTATVDSAGSTSASRQTWMVSGAVRDACRAALAEREARGGGEVDVERIYRHVPTSPLDPETGQITGERAHVSFAVARDAGRRRGRRRARPHARRLDRRRPGGRPRRRSAVGRGPDRGRDRPGPRARADGGDPDPRRPDHERELHRLPDPDGARHAAGRHRDHRGSRTRTRPTASRASASRRRSSRPPRSSPRSATRPAASCRERPVRLDDIVGLRSNGRPPRAASRRAAPSGRRARPPRRRSRRRSGSATSPARCGTGARAGSRRRG